MENAERSRPGEGSPLTRRRMLGLSTMVIGLAAVSAAGCSTAAGPAGRSSDAAGASGAPASRVTAPPPVGVLGANLDQNLDATNFAELQNLSATWMRGFFPMQDADQGDVANQPGMHKLLTATGLGYGTVLNLKFAYDKGLPTADSSDMKVAFERLDKVLAVVMDKVDILVVGNEPFFECGGKTENLNEFYEALAQHTIDYRQQHAGSSSKTQIYMGALTDLEKSNGQNVLTDRWLGFVKSTPSIAGTDCHPHVPSLSDGQKYIDYIIPRLRPDQKFLATEFSLVKLYKQHLTDAIPIKFADQYHVPRGTQVWQVVRDSIQHPVPQTEWNDFLLACPWFADTKQFISDLIGNFRKTGRCAVATFGLQQGAPMVQDFGPKKSPWVFTSMFCPHTVQPGADGLPGQNLTWTNEFRSLQHT
jgi:hypothetical protein